jgi:molybdopterin molybdotransferase
MESSDLWCIIPFCINGLPRIDRLSTELTMPEFLRLVPPDHALHLFLDALSDHASRKVEIIPTQEGLGRILAQPIHAKEPLPPFPRSTVDGYAVRAADTYGASPSLPAYLTLIGEIAMGTQADDEIKSPQAILIHTGGMIPRGADAVVMVEDTQKVKENEIEVLKPVAEGENILQLGEDVKVGEIVIPIGRRLRPQEIGGLMALGVTKVGVVQPPRVGILSTGNELISPREKPQPGQIRDINSYTLSALVRRTGGKPILRGIIPDQYDDLLQAAKKAHREDDMVIITAGSSVSTHDQTADVIQQLGNPGVLVHGVSIRPGKPTILAVADGVPLIGLPGNPVSALVVAGLFVVPVIRALLGAQEEEIMPQVHARLSMNVSSETGREDYLPVKLHPGEGGWLAEPVFGRSNLIFTLVRADGLVRIPPEATGLPANSLVTVQLF